MFAIDRAFRDDGRWNRRRRQSPSQLGGLLSHLLGPGDVLRSFLSRLDRLEGDRELHHRAPIRAVLLGHAGGAEGPKAPAHDLDKPPGDVQSEPSASDWPFGPVMDLLEGLSKPLDVPRGDANAVVFYRDEEPNALPGTLRAAIAGLISHERGEVLGQNPIELLDFIGGCIEAAAILPDHANQGLKRRENGALELHMPGSGFSLPQELERVSEEVDAGLQDLPMVSEQAFVLL
mmetsp:Transcript_15042/g.57066  ORF Transcript_15042/g.57066 Transcript_15042/m.57066 type:complete len:233 (-) Transcript_15042:1009-1707(-)|eukprot:scaffold10_cov257-Pinguiococcus_pyrenoidosus.AAC.24